MPASHHASRGSPFRHLAGTVLLVDDDLDLLDGMGRGLRHSDYRVLMADCAQRALELLSREPVDVIVSDLQMPSMSGLELLDRARDLRPDAIRIVLTGHPTTESAMEAINEDEVFRYLAKPVSRDQLAATLRLAFERLELERERARAANAPQRPVVAVATLLSTEERDALRTACEGFSRPEAEDAAPGRPGLPPWRR